MSSGAGHVDKTCPKCAEQGDVVRATAAQRDVIVVDLRCGKCQHKWSVSLANHRG
jgi:hypothetical protein